MDQHHMPRRPKLVCRRESIQVDWDRCTGLDIPESSRQVVPRNGTLPCDGRETPDPLELPPQTCARREHFI